MSEDGDGAGAAEDALLGRLIAAAAQICEAFIGQWVMVRTSHWRGVFVEYSRTLALPARPVLGVDSVTLVQDGEADLILPPHEYHIIMDRDGAAEVRVEGRYGRRTARVEYRAGLASNRAEVPEGLRHGMIRMVQHLYETRAAPELGSVAPAAVAALWQPWRRVTLGAPRRAGGR
jgi:uncharacterized phiE125 gp8 family phage protein